MSLYRKFRPQKFSELVGQDHVRQTLLNALTTGNFSHAYLFAGPKGSGKTTTARLLAKALNCQGRKLGKDGVEPCNKCRSCKEITLGRSMDVIEIDAASNRGIDEIRDLREKIKFAPTSSTYKVYVIDECHMLTKEAFNALLKTLEEPPKHAVFIMATTEAHKVPPTILSRAQVFDFRKAKFADILKLLEKITKAENIKIEPEALHLITRLSYGAFRDAISMLDQVSTLATDGRHKITLAEVQEVLGQATEAIVWEFVDNLASRNRKSALKLVENIYYEGIDLQNFLSEVVGVFRKIILIKAGLPQEFEASSDEEKKLQNLSEQFETQELINILEKLTAVSGKVRSSTLGQLPLEMAVFELTSGLQYTKIYENTKGEIIESEPSVLKANRGGELHGQERAERLDPVATLGRPRSVSLTGTGEQRFSSQVWPEVVKEIKAHNNTLAALLRDAAFAGTDDGRIILAVKFKFHAEQICAKKNIQVLEQTIKKITGKDYKVECEVNPDLSLKKPIEPEEELLNNAKEVFEVEE